MLFLMIKNNKYLKLYVDCHLLGDNISHLERLRLFQILNIIL